MRFLRLLFWFVFLVVVTAFSANNWQSLTLRLWGAIVLDIKLPVLIVAAFLAGLLPGMILHRTSRWRMRRRLDSAERTLADLHKPGAADPVPDMPPPVAL